MKPLFILEERFLFYNIGGNNMAITSFRELIIFLLVIYVSAGAGYTRAHSNNWKEWLNDFFE